MTANFRYNNNLNY